MTSFIILFTFSSFCIFIANIVSSITGFGISTILLPIFLNFFPFTTTLLFVTVIHLFNNIFKAYFFRTSINKKLLIIFGIFSLLGTLLGVFVLSKIVFLISNRVIGITLLLYVALFFIRPSFVLPQSLITLCAGGFISGFFAGILGIHGAIRGATLATFDISKATYMSTIGIIGIMVDIIRLAGYLSMDFRMPLLLTISTPIYIIISFLGAFIGQTWLKKIPYQRFRLIIVIAIGLVAIRLIFMHHY